MPVYSYKGLDGRGKAKNGIKDAESAKVLRALLRKDGIFLTELVEDHSSRSASAAQKAGAPAPSRMSRQVSFKKFFDRVQPSQVAVLTRQLATLLRAGIPLAESLAALTDQAESEKLKRTLGDIRQKVNEGSALCDCLAAHPEVFPDLYVNMVRAGETAGNLEAVLARLADFLDAQIVLRGKVGSAILYPAIMVIVGVIILAILMIVVVPKITTIFEDSGKALPWNTQLLIFASSLAGRFWYLFAILAGLAVYLFRKWLRTPVGRTKWDRILLRLWLVGPLVRMIALSRFAKTLGTMLSAGVPLLRALDITRTILGNKILEKVVEEARDSIREGESIAAPLRRSGEFPPLVVHMIEVGERSGALEQMLENVSMAYDREVEMKVGRLTTMLEPLMIVLMGGTVAFVVFSILMPILQMNDWIA